MIVNNLKINFWNSKLLANQFKNLFKSSFWFKFDLTFANKNSWKFSLENTCTSFSLFLFVRAWNDSCQAYFKSRWLFSVSKTEFRKKVSLTRFLVTTPNTQCIWFHVNITNSIKATVELSTYFYKLNWIYLLAWALAPLFQIKKALSINIQGVLFKTDTVKTDFLAFDLETQSIHYMKMTCDCRF